LFTVDRRGTTCYLPRGFGPARIIWRCRLSATWCCRIHLPHTGRWWCLLAERLWLQPCQTNMKAGWRGYGDHVEIMWRHRPAASVCS